MKVCRKCGENKPVCDFNKNRAMRDGLNSYCKPCHRTEVKTYKAARPEWRQQKSREERERLRQQVLTAYGNKCGCCGETTPEFLALDHVAGGGSAHRRAVKQAVYRDVRRRGFPKDEFQLLCHNCNTAKGLYGRCPHFTN